MDVDNFKPNHKNKLVYILKYMEVIVKIKHFSNSKDWVTRKKDYRFFSGVK